MKYARNEQQNPERHVIKHHYFLLAAIMAQQIHFGAFPTARCPGHLHRKNRRLTTHNSLHKRGNSSKIEIRSSGDEEGRGKCIIHGRARTRCRNSCCNALQGVVQLHLISVHHYTTAAHLSEELRDVREYQKCRVCGFHLKVLGLSDNSLVCRCNVQQARQFFASLWTKVSTYSHT